MDGTSRGFLLWFCPRLLVIYSRFTPRFLLIYCLFALSLSRQFPERAIFVRPRKRTGRGLSACSFFLKEGGFSDPWIGRPRGFVSL